MIALMWILTWLPPVLSAMTELPKPVNLTLTSKYFRGTSWTLVDGCNNVRDPLVCNVTDELCDPWEVYFFQVIALRGAQLSKSDIHPEFKPIRDTHMDLPQLTVTPCHRALCVDLNPPMEHLRKIYDNLTYKLKIKSNSSDRAEQVSEYTNFGGSGPQQTILCLSLLCRQSGTQRVQLQPTYMCFHLWHLFCRPVDLSHALFGGAVWSGCLGPTSLHWFLLSEKEATTTGP
ncbi:uncharacterized protein AKAME5_002846000, partial [Lates japonicus]